MSTTIDKKVVEMQFDNSNFEKNIEDTISSLERLKANLKFEGAAKGLESINTSANKVNMNGLSNAIGTVQSRFSAMEVIGVTALANITNSAVNAGKRLVSSLTIDNVVAGWNKYAEKTASVQTLVNSTGKSIEEIESYLDKLMWFSDETSYSFTEMSSALAQMTSSGGDIEKLIPMITGIANATAFAGKGSAEFQSTIRNLAQSYQAGFLQLQDMKSLNLMGTSSKQLKETFISVAESLGKIEKGTVTLENFDTTLKDKWADTEVMERALGIFSALSEAAYEAVNAGEYETASEAIEALSKNFDELSVRAFASAQEAKTFTEAIGATKDAVGTVWMKIFESIFGNYEKAKRLWTDLANSLYDVFVEPMNSLYEIVDAVMTYNPFAVMFEKLNKPLSNITKSLEYYQEMVDKVWNGDYKNQPFRKGLLEAEGHNFSTIQWLVNKGYDYKLTVEDVAKAEEVCGTATDKLAYSLENLSDAQLEELGLTKEEIKMFRQLEAESKRTGKSIKELIDEMSKKDGRSLLIESFANAGTGLKQVLEAIGAAWSNIFPANPIAIYNAIAAFNNFSKKLVMSEETVDKLTRTFQGLFAIIDITTTIIGGGLKIAFKVLKTILGMVNIDILGFTAMIGDGIVAIRDFVDATMEILCIKPLANLIVKTAKAVYNWAVNNEYLKKGLEYLKTDVLEYLKTGLSYIVIIIKKLATYIKPLGKQLWNVIKWAWNWISTNKYVVQGVTDLKNGIMFVINYLKKLATDSKIVTKFLETFKSKINDLSKSFGKWYEGLKESDNIPKYIIEGLIKGLQNGASKVVDTILNIGTLLIESFKKLLGIHSPSRVFYAIGGFVVAGLIAGIIAAFPDLRANIKGMMSGVVQTISAIDFGSLFTALISGGMVVAALKLTTALQSFAEPFEEFGYLMEQSGRAVKRVSKGIASNLRTKALQNLAVAIAILAGSIYVLSKIDIGKAWNAVGIISVLAIVLGGLIVALDKLLSTKTENLGKQAISMGKIAVLLLSMSFSLLLLASAVKKIANLSWDEWTRGLIGIGVLVGAFVGIIAVARFIGKDIGSLGTTLLQMAVSVLLMVYLAKSVSKLDPARVVKGTLALVAFGGLIVAFMWATKLINGSKNVDKIGNMILKFAAAMLLMTYVVKIAGGIKDDRLSKGTAVMTGFATMILGFMAVTKLITGSKNIDKVGKTILMVAGAIAIMALVTNLLAFMSPKNLIKGTLAITAFAGIIVGLMAATKLVSGSKNVDKIGKTILMIAGAIAVLAIIATLLSLVKVGNLIKGITAVGLLAGMIAGLIYVTKYAKKCVGNLIVMTVAFGILAAAIGILSFVDPKKLFSATAAMGILMALFALVIKVASNVKKGMGTMIALTVAIGLLGAALYMIGQLPVKASLGAAAALSTLMVAMVAALLVISKVNIGIKNVITGVLGLVALCVPLLALVGILALMQNIQNATANAAILAGLATALTLLLIPLSAIGVIYAATGGTAMLGIVGLLAMCVPLLGLVGILALMQNIQGALANTSILTTLMTAMTGCLVVISAVGPMALIGVTALTALSTLLVVMGGVVTVIGGLVKKFPFLETFVDTGIPLLEKLSNGLGSVLGNFVSGFAISVMSGLPQIGLMLSQFMLNATPFIVGMKLVDNSLLTSVKTLAETFLILTGTNLLDKLTSWLTGGNSLANFGTQLARLAISLNEFANELGTFDESKVTTVTCAANAIKSLATAASVIPNEGGLWAKIAGENSLAAFGESLPDLGKTLKEFITNLGSFDESKVAIVDCAGRAIQALANAAKSLPNEGGLWSAIIGENSLATFAGYLPDLGKNLNGFITNLGSFDESKIATVDCAANAIKSLAAAASAIPNEGGLWAKIVGENSLADFGGKLPNLGKDIKEFVGNLGEFKDSQLKTVNAACAALRSIAKLGEINIKSTGKNLTSFGDNMVKFAKKIKDFMKEIGGIGASSIESAVTKVSDLITMAQTIADTNVNSLKTFGESLKKFAKDGIDGFVNEFTSEAPKTKVKDGVNALVHSALSAFESDTLKTGVSNAGKAFTQGFANGITNNKYLARDAASEVGKLALSAAKKAIDSNSPSKESEKIGNFFGQGFVIGVKDYASKVYDASYDVADKAKDGLSRAISTVTNLLSSDMDARPTIRPILDLSDVENGASYLNSMFSKGTSIGISSNLRAISSSMNARNQNGINSDVVSAIDKLRGEIGNVGGDTYNINGVSVDDDSNVRDAVQTIVRAAVRERRA